MKVGQDVRALCGKCGETWHVVIALVDGRAAKVECGDCHAHHRYRVAGGAPARRVSGTRKASTRRKLETKDVVEADPTKPVRVFQTTDSFEVGERLSHPTLGEGVVQALAGPTKIEVLFGAERKTLVHARK